MRRGLINNNTICTSMCVFYGMLTTHGEHWKRKGMQMACVLLVLTAAELVVGESSAFITPLCDMHNTI